TFVLAEERPQQPILLVDPGDMDTTMHREAIPDADAAGLLRPRDVARVLVDAIVGADPGLLRIALAERLAEPVA
ncbi:MAG: hypothetical protein ABR975_10400, partial [Vulcanimicrobiaceae bacterium]